MGIKSAFLQLPYLTAPKQSVASMVSELVAQARSKGGESERRVLAALLSGSGPGGFAIFSDHGNFGCTEDEAAAWLWVSAASGHHGAVVALEQMVERRSVDLVPEPDVDEADAEAEGLDDVSFGPSPPPEGRVVIPRVGDPDSKEGKELAKRFSKVVGRPLPFVGIVPEPGVLRAEIVKRWPWAESVADRVEGQLALLRRSGSPMVRLPPILLVGAPGCGKSSLARFLCERLGLKTTFLPCGGASDAAGVAPITRGWSTARPGAFALAVASYRVANPAFVLDEIEKSPPVGNQNGSVQGTLLGVVGDAGPDGFTDACLLGPVDVSGMTFLATANSLATLDPALRDRFMVVRIDSPRDRDLHVLLANCRREFTERNNIPAHDVPMLSGESVATLGEFLSGYRSARKFYEAYEVMVRHLIVREEMDAVEPRLLN